MLELVEAGQKAVNKDEHLKKLYQRLVYRRDRAKAKFAIARGEGESSRQNS